MMDALKYGQLFKNNSMKRGDAMKVASNLRTKKQREISRHQIRQTNRNMCDSEEENVLPSRLESSKSKRCEIGSSSKKIILTTEQYLSRLHRLREFSERKRTLEQEKVAQRAPFIPCGLKPRLLVHKSDVIAVDRAQDKAPPLQERQDIPIQQTSGTQSLAAKRMVKPRVDCWRKNEPPTRVVDGVGTFKRPLSAKKMQGNNSSQRPTKPKVRPIKTAKEVKPSTSKISKNFLHSGSMSQPARPPADLITSTARKQTKAVLQDTCSLFDSISPIELEPTPSTSTDPRERTSNIAPILSSKNSNERSSIWNPQPVAFIFKASALDSSAHETAVIPSILKKGGSVSDTDQATDPAPALLPNKTFSTRRRSTVWSIASSSEADEPSGLEITKDHTIDMKPPSTTALSRRRSTLVFTEERIASVISPSVSNIKQDEANAGRTATEKCIAEHRSSSSSSESMLLLDDYIEQQTSEPPKEVLEKTLFYYEKMDSELSRLQALCAKYAPFLNRGENELNDHCKGLIIAAQGQTNIFINKKLTKFRELLVHYEKEWNDRKVRNDDLDGFWLMLSLDLENLDKRFDELRVLQENNWQEVVPEPPTRKEKKLRGGGGIKKRDQKTAITGACKPSSAIANLIRKARQEQLKQKSAHIDLGTLSETVTVVKTPFRKSARIAATPKRNSFQKRSSLSTGFTPTVKLCEPDRSLTTKKRQTIFPEITQRKDGVKSILKTPNVSDNKRAKSVLFLDSGLDTPQSRRRQSSRTVVDTPKPKIKFNCEHEVETIDNLVDCTPSRLSGELKKTRRQSRLVFSSPDKEEERYPRGTPHNNKSDKRNSRNLRSLLNAENADSSGPAEQEELSAKLITRSSARKSRKRTIHFS